MTGIDRNWGVEFLTYSKHRISRHLFIIIFFSIILYNSSPEVPEPTLILVFFLFIFYINMYLLVPLLLFKNKYILYILSILSIITFSAVSYKITHYFFEVKFEEDGLNIPLFSSLIIVLVSASSSIKLFQKWIIDKQLILELEKENSLAELEQLKNQINPHFLFNTLNNANVLTKKNPEKASEVLIKLSDLLRYQLYDSTREKVLLTSDIHFLEDFLNLEKIRRDNFDFLISKEGDLNGVQIPPLLFISFVENAVKHNNDSTKSSYINLYFDVRNNELFFKCINSKPILKTINSISGGIGLTNIKRRLQLLFPLNHKLSIENNLETFCVTLTIKL